MDDVHIPFTMQARVSYGDAPPDPDPLFTGPLPPGWVRIPFSMDMTLPDWVLDGTRPEGDAGGGAAAVSIVPGSLRLGDGVDADGRTWPDAGSLLAALHEPEDGPPGPSGTPEPSIVPAFERSLRRPPVPPPVELSRLPASPSDAPSASNVAWLNRPVPGMGALRAAVTSSAALNADAAG